MNERTLPEQQERVRRFISDLCSSDGALIPVTGGVSLLRTTFVGPRKEMADNCLTLFHTLSDSEQIVPFGWIGLRIMKDQELTRALLVDLNLYLLIFKKSSGIDFDPVSRIARLKESRKHFSVGNENGVFNAFKAVLKVNHEQRNQGWGKFLIQTAAQVALTQGSDALACEENAHDTTIDLSRTKQSLYTRSLGVGPKPHHGGWTYALGSQTPVDQIIFALN